MLSFYQGSLIKALQNVYPDIGIQPQLFQVKNRIILHDNRVPNRILDKYWHDKENRRNFFENFIHQTGQPIPPIRSWSGIYSVKVAINEYFMFLTLLRVRGLCHTIRILYQECWKTYTHLMLILLFNLYNM